MQSHNVFSIIRFSIDVLLNKHTGSISSLADFFFQPFPTGHGLLAVIIVFKEGVGTLSMHCMCIYTKMTGAYEGVRERSLR